MTDGIPDIYEDVLHGKQYHSLDKHYQKKYVLPGGIIPGPKKPKNLDFVHIPQTPSLMHNPG